MDENYMRLALTLAEKGRGRVNPNPMVGAVIVKNGTVIGEGYHQVYGQNHAEVNAFKDAKENTFGATLYVTLEPCYHHGKTPPCVDKIIEKKIKRVVIGSLDPNPLVAGRGVKKLRDSGIIVDVGILEKECIALNEIFIKYISTKKPFVIMKTAMSLDGKIATQYGESKWITGEASRKNVHNLRNNIMGIMVGANTVIKDNPELTCRVLRGKNPIRIILDSSLKIPLNSKVIKDKKARTIIVTTEKATKENISIYTESGVEVVVIPSKDEKVNLEKLMETLGEMNIDSILLEGGGTVNFEALKAGIVDKIQIYIAPKFIGGGKSKTPVEGIGIKVLEEAYGVESIRVSTIGEDILIEGYMKERWKPCLQE
ncbi:bifunctional diaminohydroxyphosphoribosylaminopyrimidine deaminase/5-amino-6-(5-phosphoribosylamino)uracil reductase RibD [Clostridium sp. UBA5119]|uniref:bifunctional diaminohydroxyphosphoribosylaminopyrimidine deaminase/5-amino-6-(5-phosphoribosylamino)uracil reductase RibD n=1 Tax=Clostridium sp. UBA5119 TaxID=1946366 RepID=UPI0032168E6D